MKNDSDELQEKADAFLESIGVTLPKGIKQMPKKMTKQTIALMKWRSEHSDENGKVVIPRRSPTVILDELMKKKAFYTQRMEMIDKKIRYYDNRINANKRKKLVSQLTTEQLEKLVASIKGL